MHEIRPLRQTEDSTDRYASELRYRRRAQRTKWENFKYLVYDPETREVFGRDRTAWCRVGLFYLAFLVVLAVMVAVCMRCLFMSLDDKTPTRLLEDSLIGTNPGLAFRPMSDDLAEGALISYSVREQASVVKWVRLLDRFLEPYYANSTGANVVRCGPYRHPKDDEVCDVNPNTFGKCSKAVSPDYGYGQGSPCIFIKLNRIYAWRPEFYTGPQKTMPVELNAFITREHKPRRSQIWVSCQGQTSSDQENAKTFSYYPHGFAGYYYPYTNNKNYLSPLVAVQIHKPTRNVLINIECRAWAKNIKYVAGVESRQGSVVLDLLINDVPAVKAKKKLDRPPKTL